MLDQIEAVLLPVQNITFPTLVVHIARLAVSNALNASGWNRSETNPGVCTQLMCKPGAQRVCVADHPLLPLRQSQPRFARLQARW